MNQPEIIEVTISSPYRFILNIDKKGFKIFSQNLTSKIKFAVNLTKSLLKDNDVGKSLKGIHRLLSNGLSKTDQHVKVELFFMKNIVENDDDDGEIEGALDINEDDNVSMDINDDNLVEVKNNNKEEEKLNCIKEVDEDYEISDDAINEGGMNHTMNILLTYTSDYDEVFKYLIKLQPVKEDEISRLKDMALDRAAENSKLEKQIIELKKLVSESGSHANFLELKVIALLQAAKRIKYERKLKSRISSRLRSLQNDLLILKSSNKKDDMEGMLQKVAILVKNPHADVDAILVENDDGDGDALDDDELFGF